MAEGKLSKVEKIKEDSRYLRGTVAEELQKDTDHFSEADYQILKFHGMYQQDDRDVRVRKDKVYSFMIRTKLPGGRLTAEQYLAHDDLATQYGNSTLRITTRQGFQLHGIVKGDLKQTLRELNESMVTTLGACGDVVRNTVCCPAPTADRAQSQIQAFAQRISDHMLPHSKAYYETWINGEKIYDSEEGEGKEIEPIYGKFYLPRKFKMGIAYPGDNCIDIYTQDVGLVAIMDGETLLGFNVLVGGGLGMTHNKADTFPRLADPMGYITPDQVIDVITEIVRTQRDHGDRTNRKHARLKYLIHEWGLERFKAEVERRVGYQFQPVAPMPPFELDLHLGWHDQGDGHWYLGISVENGRVQDVGNYRLKSGIRAVLEQFHCNMRLTTSHDILLTDIHPDQKASVEATLRHYGIKREHELSNIQLYSMACPAMPTCGLAIAEAERALPGVIDKLEVEIERLGLQDEKLAVRMTGCPNGCARPYVADVGFVGRSLNMYTVFVGGKMNGTRLNQIYKDLVHLDVLVDTVLPLFIYFKASRLPSEDFGDFCSRIGIEALQQYASRDKVIAIPAD
ncbi:MAG: NADPH-dependent assimilatory sulfite reductase hemoprotein subunit [Chloroflexi bacterium]|nr:NADPH-dependent assimilatory sulfite reductase hemoprotein subunit [Chloroflexota bacterium]